MEAHPHRAEYPANFFYIQGETREFLVFDFAPAWLLKPNILFKALTKARTLETTISTPAPVPLPPKEEEINHLS